jgi:hypothetical protein
MTYKRNQIEEAIGRLFRPNAKELDSELATRIKRLLELDRALGRKHRSRDAEEANFAFFSDEAPGTGVDISFSGYETFALLNALRIMQHGWPQGFAVAVMRRMRPDLESEHGRILKQPADKLFDQEAIIAKARAGDIAVDNTDPVFLTFASRAKPDPDDAKDWPAFAVCRGLAKVGQFSRVVGASSLTVFELVTLAHRLRGMLMNTEPKSRGRPRG